MNLHEAAQQALEALEKLDEQELATGDIAWLGKEIGDLRVALAEPVQESVKLPTTAAEAELMAKVGLMWREQNADTGETSDHIAGAGKMVAPLTDEELYALGAESHEDIAFVRRVLAAHGIGGEE